MDITFLRHTHIRICSKGATEVGASVHSELECTKART